MKDLRPRCAGRSRGRGRRGQTTRSTKCIVSSSLHGSPARGSRTSAKTHRYSIMERYAVGGFFSPVDNLPVVNMTKAGLVVPAKWNLIGGDGRYVSSLTSFTSLTSGDSRLVSAADRRRRGTQSGPSSVTARSRCADALALLGLTARLGRPTPPGIGMGSVGQGGSVGPSKTRAASSPFSRRTALSELLKIRVSLVRFRPWPPFPTR